MNTVSTGDAGRIFSSIAAGGYTVKFRGFSAIDIYIGLPPMPFSWIETNADIAALARFVDELRFPGVDIADAAMDTPCGTYYFHCTDNAEMAHNDFSLFSLTYDFKTRFFQDPLGIYPLLKELKQNKEKYLKQDNPLPNIPDIRAGNRGRYSVIMDAALLLARYGTIPANLDSALDGFAPDNLPEPEAQRAFLVCLLVSPRPDWGLELVKKHGLLEKIWPELACLDEVDHAKEYHPEGNVWNHTLETFRHRKAHGSGAFDLILSLGLLLHDAGKPVADTNRSRRFDGHAELGAHAAARFLGHLGFSDSMISDVYYLVRNHMLPAALKRLPLSKTAEIMASPLFPTLMELYRCDESSSFKGLDGYYENSAAYQAYLKNSRNPYRSPDGKKIGQREIYSKM